MIGIFSSEKLACSSCMLVASVDFLVWTWDLEEYFKELVKCQPVFL